MFQPFEHFLHYLAVLFKVLTIDEDIIHIDCYFPFCYKVCEYQVHEGLEGCWTVGYSKVHDFWFI